MATRQAGNAIIIILIAVFLFGALAATFMRGSRTGQGNLTAQQAKLVAQEIMMYGTQLEKATNKIRQNNCSENQINLNNTTEAGYTNPDAPSDGSCDLFSANGGNVSWLTPPNGSNDGSPYHFVGGPVIHTRDGRNSTYDAANAELVMYLADVNAAVCSALNTNLGITGIPVDQNDVPSFPKFTGTFTAEENVMGLLGSQPSPCIAAPGTGLCGRNAGCFQEENGGQRYLYYHIILSR